MYLVNTAIYAGISNKMQKCTAVPHIHSAVSTFCVKKNLSQNGSNETLIKLNQNIMARFRTTAKILVQKRNPFRRYKESFMSPHQRRRKDFTEYNRIFRLREQILRQGGPSFNALAFLLSYLKHLRSGFGLKIGRY